MKKEYLIKIPYVDKDEVKEFNLTPYIIAGTYLCHNVDEFESYKDANYKTHYYLICTKIKGSCEILIKADKEMHEFLQALKLNRLYTIEGGDDNPATNQLLVYNTSTDDFHNIECKVEALEPKIKRNTQNVSYVKFTFEFEEV